MILKRFALAGAIFTLAGWLAGIVLAVLTAYLYATLRGDMLPNGSQGMGSPISFWVGVNFRHYLPGFMLVGSFLGVAVGQAQLWMWLRLGSPGQAAGPGSPP